LIRTNRFFDADAKKSAGTSTPTVPNDTNVTIVGQSVSDLMGTWSNIPANPYGIASSNTNNVPTGCQRRDFSVNGGTNNRTFLRLKASQ
jgi:hypothetical protein